MDILYTLFALTVFGSGIALSANSSAAGIARIRSTLYAFGQRIVDHKMIDEVGKNITPETPAVTPSNVSQLLREVIQGLVALIVIAFGFYILAFAPLASQEAKTIVAMAVGAIVGYYFSQQQKQTP